MEEKAAHRELASQLISYLYGRIVNSRDISSGVFACVCVHVCLCVCMCVCVFACVLVCLRGACLCACVAYAF